MKPRVQDLEGKTLASQELVMIRWLVNDLRIPQEAAAPLLFSYISESKNKKVAFVELLDNEADIAARFMRLDHAVSVWMSIYILDVLSKPKGSILVNRIRVMHEAKLSRDLYAALIIYLAASGIILGVTRGENAGYEIWGLNEDFVDEFTERMSQHENLNMVSVAREYLGATKALAKRLNSKLKTRPTEENLEAWYQNLAKKLEVDTDMVMAAEGYIFNSIQGRI